MPLRPFRCGHSSKCKMENFPNSARSEVPPVLSPFLDGSSGGEANQSSPQQQSKYVLSIFGDARESAELIKRGEFIVPPYYLRSALGSESELKLRPSQIKQFSLDSLFFCFHCLPDDILQTVAGQELLSRGWRYHRDNSYWVRPAAPADRETLGAQPRQFVYFDADSWTPKVLLGHLDHTRLMVASEHAPSARAPNLNSLKTGPLAHAHH